jgi:hypothetical protein
MADDAVHVFAHVIRYEGLTRELEKTGKELWPSGGAVGDRAFEAHRKAVVSLNHTLELLHHRLNQEARARSKAGRPEPREPGRA